MTSTRSWIAAALTAATLVSGWASTGQAQDKPKDETLEKLLEKLDGKDKVKPDPGKPKDAETPKDKDSTTAKPKETPTDKPKEKAADKPNLPGQVTPQDQDLDKLLEGLGQAKDGPSPEDKKTGGRPDDPMPPKGDQARPDDLKGGEQDLDKELEKITGKKEKPKNSRDRKGEEDGPLGGVIKEMRDVEERLGKPDTGEQTRKKQTEIVKNLKQLIERMENAPSQSLAMKMMRGEANKPGPQPGGPQGNRPGAQAQGPPPARPNDPKKPRTPVALDKSVWGQLPPSFREQMGNVMSEHPLPTRRDLIEHYYLSLGKKTANRED